MDQMKKEIKNVPCNVNAVTSLHITAACYSVRRRGGARLLSGSIIFKILFAFLQVLFRHNTEWLLHLCTLISDVIRSRIAALRRATGRIPCTVSAST